MADVVNATRMELTRLKNQLATTRRGHHLLKDKQDEMMRQFLLQIESYKALRKNVDQAWLQALDTFSYAKSFHFEEELKEKFLVPASSVKLEFGKQSVMSVDVPKVKILETFEPKVTYSFHGTHPALDTVVAKLGKLLPDLIQMAVEDKKNRILIKEIEKTKRRVNAIEHIIIPEIVDDIKVVRMKISDAERSNTVRIMKSKDLIIKKNLQNK
ncbi:V-type ATP synthase subunit D [Acholeplasma hippikon]|uniref:V-type ATP synthase subunit D n=1 Tax=Acholeplasma hippikon TaxID=264636 RepID=A0A449BI56_9MOLU|nr:V-type ATP synthase subunit D [Acholeplasma hippikon]VEU82017.1 V-type sodium pump subunit D [Acholeplasma hippikon]